MPNDKLLYLGNCIRTARTACSLTQQELADQANVAHQNCPDDRKRTDEPIL